MIKINMLFTLLFVANIFALSNCTSSTEVKQSSISEPKEEVFKATAPDEIEEEMKAENQATIDEESSSESKVLNPDVQIDSKVPQKKVTANTNHKVEPSVKDIQKPIIEDAIVKKEPAEVSFAEIVKPVEKQEKENDVKDSVQEESQEILSNNEKNETSKDPMQVVSNHQMWDDLLTRYVTDNGQVDYAAIKAKPIALEAYIKELDSQSPLPDWSANKEKAYWINAYNAFTVKLIVDNYPVNSITDLHGGKPWDVSWIKLGGKTYSLNDIEHKILRPKFNDARIHFAVNCAAKSCPKIWNRAWTEENIESALDKLTRAFVANQTHNQIREDKASLSKIFEWYRGDFGDLITFLNKYSKTKLSSNASIAFNDYNWKLNS